MLTSHRQLLKLLPFSAVHDGPDLAGAAVSIAWYVTFEIYKRSQLPKKTRSRRETRTFATEAEAKIFAQQRFREGLVVFAGSINPHAPRRLILFPAIPDWLTVQDASKGDENR